LAKAVYPATDRTKVTLNLGNIFLHFAYFPSVLTHFPFNEVNDPLQDSLSFL
jgi:hypothetical protein